MNRKMALAWNEVVHPDDLVYLLGDVGFAKPDTLIPFLLSLHGEKILIRGNHDKALLKGGMPQRLIDEGVFTSIHQDLEVTINGQFFVLHHYAKRTWNKAHHGTIHLFGHTHGDLEPLGKSLDVGVDDKNITDEYRPYSLEEVLRFMNKQEIHTKHHGDRGED